MELTGKNVLITGGSTGIGFETCKCLLKNGISGLAILDIVKDTAGLTELLSTWTNSTIMYLKTDVSQKSEIEKNFTKTIEEFDQIDIVVNCAGVAEKSAEITIGVNLFGTIYLNSLAQKYFSNERNDSGLILNVASVVGFEPMAMDPIYTASKHGVVGYTRAMAKQNELNKTNIRFITVCPGLTITSMTENVRKLVPNMKGQTAAECASNIIVALKSNKNGSIWILDQGKIREVTPTVYWTQEFES